VNSYIPSLFELEEYCMSKDHRKCPFYLKGMIRERELETCIAGG
jgi:hypothetical protein